mgnify:CR=1 FL=1
MARRHQHLGQRHRERRRPCRAIEVGRGALDPVPQMVDQFAGKVNIRVPPPVSLIQQVVLRPFRRFVTPDIAAEIRSGVGLERWIAFDLAAGLASGLRHLGWNVGRQ